MSRYNRLTEVAVKPNPAKIKSIEPLATKEHYKLLDSENIELRTLVNQLQAENKKIKEENHKLSTRPKKGWLDRLWNPDDDVVEIGFKVTRDAAFAAIDSERKHMIWIGYTVQPVAHYLLLMEHYLLKARDNWACSKKAPLDELDNIRKVGALAVACMEAHGAPPRVKSKTNPIPNQPDKHADR